MGSSEPGLDLTAPLRDAIAEAEQLIANAPFIRTEQDLLEGYDYLSGRIRMAMQMAFDHNLDRPLFINSTHQFSRQGLDNPDAVYFSAYLREGVEYVVGGRRGTSADLSFQVMGGAYSADSVATSLLAFDDRELEVAEDGSFEFRYTAEPGAKTLIVREVFNDWDTEERGTLWIERVDDLSWWPTPEDDTAGWFPIDRLGPAVRRLLVEAGRTYVPFMLANAAALESGADEVVCEIDGQEYRQGPFKYQGKCLRWVRDEYAALDDHSRAKVDTLLAGTGCEAIVTA